MLSDIVYDFYDAEDYKNLIKSILKTFRTSKEYLLWLEKYDRDECAATGLSKITDGVEIEMHHHNITLWNWVEKIIDDMMNENLPLNTFYICIILNDLHFNQCIPCVPLSHDIHKMIGNDPQSILDKYPQIEEKMYKGDLNLANEIIQYHIKNYKNILINEEKLKNE